MDDLCHETMDLLMAKKRSSDRKIWLEESGDRSFETAGELVQQG
jgi:hypothetical protein